jgi:hypothetical protein
VASALENDLRRSTLKAQRLSIQLATERYGAGLLCQALGLPQPVDPHQLELAALRAAHRDEIALLRQQLGALQAARQAEIEVLHEQRDLERAEHQAEVEALQRELSDARAARTAALDAARALAEQAAAAEDRAAAAESAYALVEREVTRLRTTLGSWPLWTMRSGAALAPVPELGPGPATLAGPIDMDEDDDTPPLAVVFGEIPFRHDWLSAHESPAGGPLHHVVVERIDTGAMVITDPTWSGALIEGPAVVVDVPAPAPVPEESTLPQRPVTPGRERRRRGDKVVARA